MSKKPFDGQFRKDIYILHRATKGEVYLSDYPKLSKKIKKYYEGQGIEFYDDPESDNLYLLDLIKDELKCDIAV